MPISKETRDRSRELRANSTKAERLLWKHLGKKQLADLHFRRQVPLGPYFADFLCYEVKLIVEVDGGQHGELSHVDYDESRTQFLMDEGFHVLRFWNSDVIENVEGVLTSIRNVALKRKPIPPPEKSS